MTDVLTIIAGVFVGCIATAVITLLDFFIALHLMPYLIWP